MIVFSETLRLHSPAFFTRRVCSKDYKVDENLTIPKDMVVTVPIREIQRDPEHYDEPLQFKPERFQNNHQHHPLTFLAFGAGPRNCIGE